MIQIKDLNLTIREHEILKNINLSLADGRIHGLIGRNGSGKTMLMKCICGYVKPTTGEVYVDDAQIGKDRDFPERMGVIIENPGFIPYYSGYRNLKFLADLQKRIKPEDIRSAIELVGLDPNLKLPVRKYSLGMRQRLGLAQAIMEDPKLLILDEPLNGLDEDGVKQMRELFLKLKAEGKTIILASHSAEDIGILCDTVHRLDKGVMSVVRE